MNFINAERRPQSITLPALVKPGLVGPGKLASVPHNGGVFGWRLEEETIRVSFQQNMTVQVANFVFVESPFTDARNEDFPNAGRSKGAHLMETAIPVVEIAHDADPLSVWSPHSEARSLHSVERSQLRAK